MRLAEGVGSRAGWLLDHTLVSRVVCGAPLLPWSTTRPQPLLLAPALGRGWGRRSWSGGKERIIGEDGKELKGESKRCNKTGGKMKTNEKTKT